MNMNFACKSITSIILIILFLLIFTLNTTIASEQPFKFAGVIDSIHEDALVISDTQFNIADGIQIYNSADLTITLSDISLGDKVGCNFIRTENNQLIITELYKLHETFDLEEFGLRLHVLYSN